MPAVVVKALEKFVHLRETFDSGQVILLEKLGAIFIQLFAETLYFFRGEKLRQILIGALTDLGAQLLEGELFSEVAEGGVP